MRRTHLSLYYLAGYLVPAGLLLLFVPEWATKLLLSNRTYDYAPKAGVADFKRAVERAGYEAP